MKRIILVLTLLGVFSTFAPSPSMAQFGFYYGPRYRATYRPYYYGSYYRPYYYGGYGGYGRNYGGYGGYGGYGRNYSPYSYSWYGGMPYYGNSYYYSY